MNTTHAFRMKGRLCAAVATFAGLALAAPAVLADASASASVSDVRIQLIDLDTTDGITPAISFSQGAGAQAYLSVSTWTDGAGQFHYVNVPVGSPYGQIDLHTYAADGTSMMQGGDVFGAAGMGPGASVASSASGWYASGGAVGNPLQGTITLTGNTRMVVTATVATWAQASLGDTATARTAIEFFDKNNTFNGLSSIQYSVSATGALWQDAGNSLALTWDNLGPATNAGFLKVSATVSSDSVTAVPEPQSAALMLAGLALVAAGASRRRSQRR